MSKRFWERLQSASEIALLVGCVLVVVGLAFEDWIKSLLGIGEIAVVVGVMIEGLADGGIFLASGKLQMVQQSELEHMRLETARANERSEVANRAAAEANLKAEGERFERFKLEEKLAWRSLSGSQQKTLANKLQSFPNRRIDIFTTSGDAELMSLARTFQLIVLEAGWIPSIYQWIEYTFPVPGIMIECDPKDELNQRAAEVLCNELKSCGLLAWTAPPDPYNAPSYVAPFDTPPPNAPLRLVVGDKY
jgi:hypothetical protein